MLFHRLTKITLTICAASLILKGSSQAGSAAVDRSTNWRAPQPAPEFQPFEISVGFNYIYLNDAEPETDSLYGGELSVFWNVNRWLGLGGEFMANFGSTTERSFFGSVDLDSERFVYLAGPRFTFWQNSKFRAFAEFLAGAAHAEIEADFGGFNQSVDADGFASVAGLGFDWRITDRISWRIIQADYLFTHLEDGRQDNFRASTGIVFSFGR